MANTASEQDALTTDKSAAVLGMNEFSLFACIQRDEIKVVRLPSGEIAIPESELERLLGTPAERFIAPPNQEASWPDNRLGIQKDAGGLKRNGECVEYSVPNYPGQFTEREIKSYRVAFGSIAGELHSLDDLKKQLEKLDEWPATQETQAELGRWKVCSTLLKLGQSEILLCRLENKFAVIERFHAESAYARKNGGAEILLRDTNLQQLADDFRANTQLTLEFMASNLTAKAQKVVWEQFHDDRPSQVIAAISERCRQVVAPDETIFKSQTTTHNASRGIKI